MAATSKTRIGWLTDATTYVGGAERTAKGFEEAAPEGVEVVHCPRGEVVEADRYVCHNLVTYEPNELRFNVPVFWYHHDVAPWISPETWAALDRATHICVSPLQQQRMGLRDAHLIPPTIPLGRFREAAQNANGRSGAVAVARNWWLDKGPIQVGEWAQKNGGVDFYGEGREDSRLVDYDDLPELLARYKIFVHLPRVIDPCPRTPIEAHAAGCELVLNRNVGSIHWLSEEPDKLESAAEDFWSLILGE